MIDHPLEIVPEDNQIINFKLNEKKLILDVHAMPIDEKGIPYFYWPIGPYEINQIHRQMIKRVVAAIRSAIADNLPGIDSATILYFHFVHEAIKTYQAILLIQRTKRDGYAIAPSKKHRLTADFLARKMPARGGAIKNLQMAVKKSSLARLPLRVMRDLWVGMRQHMTRRTLWPVNFQKKIISTTMDPLAIANAKHTKEKVVYRRLNTWFHVPASDEIQYRVSNDAVIALMLNAVKSAMVFDHHADDGPLHALMNEYMQTWLKEAFALVDCYSQQIAQAPKRIPKRYWTHTSGDIWGRIIAHAVKKNNGLVRRHDHGSGAGYFAYPFEQGCYDFEDCDEFIAVSSGQAEAFKKNWVPDNTIQAFPPVYQAVVAKKNIFKLGKHLSVPKKNKSFPKIMYVGSVYPGEMVYIAAHGMMSAVVMLDWETRLIQKLLSWHFDVILKPHPVEDQMPAAPNALIDLFGPIVSNKLFEDVMHEADVILFDDPTSTMFSTLVLSNKPFIYLDFKIANFSDEARELLRKRGQIVEGWYDEHNRAQIDWFALFKAIATCRRLNDDSFAKKYF